MFKRLIPWRIFRVTGDSMSPNLHNGDYVITQRWWYSLKEGDIVVVQHPDLGVVIKRILRRVPNGLFLQGDNLIRSTTTERMGLVSDGDVLGRVAWRIKGDVS